MISTGVKIAGAAAGLGIAGGIVAGVKSDDAKRTAAVAAGGTGLATGALGTGILIGGLAAETNLRTFLKATGRFTLPVLALGAGVTAGSAAVAGVRELGN